MKVNLATRPKFYLYSYDDKEHFVSAFKAWEAWAEEFEGALRQRLLDITCDGSKPHDVCCVLCLEKGESMAIQKILGDAEASP